MPKLIIIRGYPGSGKTTLGKALQSLGVGVFIDHNSILTFITSIVNDDDGIYDEIASLEKAMARKLLIDNKSVIVARGFSSADSVMDYQDISKQLDVHSVVLRLQASSDELSRRVQSPERRDDFNPTVTPAALNKWVAGNPIESVGGEVIIDANQSREEVLKFALNSIG